MSRTICVTDDTPLEKDFDSRTALAEASRCLLCHDAPCSEACPAGTDPARFIRSLRFKNIWGAAETIRENNPLGGSCALVCPSMNCAKAHACVPDLTSGPDSETPAFRHGAGTQNGHANPENRSIQRQDSRLYRSRPRLTGLRQRSGTTRLPCHDFRAVVPIRRQAFPWHPALSVATGNHRFRSRPD